jgi:hypothetical protein
MDTGRTDLLLLNASNLPTVPIFPYAFVQVSAIARRFGLNVARFDFLNAHRMPRWQSLLAELIRTVIVRAWWACICGSATRSSASDYLPPPDARSQHVLPAGGRDPRSRAHGPHA